METKNIESGGSRDWAVLERGCQKEGVFQKNELSCPSLWPNWKKKVEGGAQR